MKEESVVVSKQNQIKFTSAAGHMAPLADVTSVLHQALAFHQANLLEEAEQLYLKVLQGNSRNFDALHLLGVVYFQRGDHVGAIRQIDRALKINPKSAAAHSNLGNALKGLKRFKDAIKSYDKAISIKPDYFEAYSNRGDALNELKRFAEALSNCDRAIALKPDYAQAINNCGVALDGLKRFDEALKWYDAAIALKPDYAEAFNNRGDIFNKLTKTDAALADFEKAVALNPDLAIAFNNQGIALQILKRFDGALASYDRAIALKADYAEAFSNRGKAFGELKRLDEGLADIERALALDPELNYIKGDYLHSMLHLCDWREFEQDCARLISAFKGSYVAQPFTLLPVSAGPAVQRRCAELFIADRYPAAAPLWRGELYAHERIRVGYVSGDLREHPVAVLAAGLFEHHDKSQFETIAISFGSFEPDRMTERLKGSFERFIDVRGKGDREIAALLRELEIDIAVDLNGFTGDARPNIFAARPAPVAVNYLGYAGTLGADYWDYIVADPFVIPAETQKQYAEQVVYLPGSFMSNDDGRKIAAATPSRAEAGLPVHGFVFCCFNNSYKFTPDAFEVWMRLLRQIEGSVLWLSASNPGAMQNLRGEAEKRGVSPERLIFAPRVASNEDHLARLRLGDLFLDTLYYNAHTTACDALWAGLPLITHPGETFASRVAGSLLTAVGLPELIAPSLGDYEALALKLAREPKLLSEMRQKLARNAKTHALFNTERFTRHMEAAYRTMWQRAQRGEPAQSFAVEPGAQCI